MNDEPTLTATAAGGTFTEDGSNVALFSSADAADGDSQTTQTWKVLTFTVTNVADTTESIVVDGSTQALTDGGSTANTATNSAAVSVSISGGTATVTVTFDTGSLTDAELETMINALAYTNSDQSPTAGNRVITITTLQDEGGTANSGDDSVTVSLAATVTVAAANDAPVIANSDNTGTYTEDAGGTVTDTLVVTDADGQTPTWSCSGCTDAGSTQTLTDTYGSWVLDEASGQWTYTPDDTDTDMNSLNDAEAASETLTAVASDGTASDSITITISITGANDAPTSSTGSKSTAEDTLVTFANSDFSFSDVDDVDTAYTLSLIHI